MYGTTVPKHHPLYPRRVCYLSRLTDHPAYPLGLLPKHPNIVGHSCAVSLDTDEHLAISSHTRTQRPREWFPQNAPA
jgi:hypothetical protein